MRDFYVNPLFQLHLFGALQLSLFKNNLHYGFNCPDEAAWVDEILWRKCQQFYLLFFNSKTFSKYFSLIAKTNIMWQRYSWFMLKHSDCKYPRDPPSYLCLILNHLCIYSMDILFIKIKDWNYNK